MLPAMTINNPNDLKRVTRRFLEKTRDLEFGKKVNRILDVNRNGTPVMVDHLNSMRSLFSCTFGAPINPHISALRDRFLANLDRLIREVGTRVNANPASRKIDADFVTALLKSHRNLFEETQSSKMQLMHCPDDFSNTVNSAVLIWGNKL